MLWHSDPVFLRLVRLVSFGFPAIMTDRFQLREFRSIDYLSRIPRSSHLNPIEAKNDENTAAPGPDKIANPYFYESTITNIHSNNIVLTRSLRVLSEFPIFGADKTLVAVDRDVLSVLLEDLISVPAGCYWTSVSPGAGGLPVADERAVKRRGSGIEN